MARQAAVVRAIFVSSGGLYNCDIIPRLTASTVSIKAKYSCKGQSELPKTVYVVSQINPNGSHVTLRHDAEQYGEIAVYSSCKNLVLAIYNDGSVAALPQDNLEGLMATNSTEGNILELETIASNIKSAGELDELIKERL